MERSGTVIATKPHNYLVITRAQGTEATKRLIHREKSDDELRVDYFNWPRCLARGRGGHDGTGYLVASPHAHSFAPSRSSREIGSIPELSSAEMGDPMYQPLVTGIGKFLTILLIGVTCLLPAGCLWSPQLTGLIHESSDGTVYLEEIPDLAFEASHPIAVDPDAIEQMLQGVETQEGAKGTVAGKTGTSGRVPVFSSREAKFLAPFLSAALASAGPEHQIAFRSSHSRSSKPEVTAGTLYAYRSSLYLTLSHFRYTPRTDIRWYEAKQRLPFSTTLSKQNVRFMSESVGRPAKVRPPGAPFTPMFTTLAIDYRNLSKVSSVAGNRRNTPMPRGTAAAASPAMAQTNTKSSSTSAIRKDKPKSDLYQVKYEELQKAKKLVGQRKAEQLAMEQELSLLKQKLIEQRRLVKQLKASGKRIPPAKKTTVNPTRFRTK